MTNKSERALSAMTDEEFDDRFPSEKAAVDWFIGSIWFNTPELVPESWGCGGFVPPRRQRFQGGLFDTQELAPAFFIRFHNELAVFE